MISGYRPKPTLVSNDDHIRAWKEGYAAGQNHKAAADCPYERSTLKAAWISGFAKGERDSSSNHPSWTDDPEDPDYHVDCDPFIHRVLHFETLYAKDDPDRIEIYCNGCERTIATVSSTDYKKSFFVRDIINLHVVNVHRGCDDYTPRVVDWEILQ